VTLLRIKRGSKLVVHISAVALYCADIFINVKGSNMVAMKYFPAFVSTITYCFYGAVGQNRTADLLITKPSYEFCVYINQSLAMLAKHKISVTQLHMVVFQAQFDTNLTQSVLRSVTFKIVSKFNCMGWLAIIDTMKPW
jgi:hypothetical protein